MGRRSDSDDDYDLKKSKKKKKRRSRSRSSSSGSSRYSSKHKKSRKTKHKKRSRSRSRDRPSRRSRSRSRGRRSRSRSRGRRSRSRSRGRRSRSRSRGRRSRSRSRSRRSRSRSRGRRSRSRDRYRSRSRSREQFRTRSRSRDRYRSRSRDRYIRRRSRSDSRSRGRRSRSDSRSRSRRSRSRSRGRRSRTPEKKKKRLKKESPGPKDVQADIREQIPGFDDMKGGNSIFKMAAVAAIPINPDEIWCTPAEQANARMQLALKAAAAADEKIREQLGSGPSTSEEMTTFSNAVLDIESANFTPSAFRSSRGDKAKTEPADDGYTTHEQAMFGAGRVDIKLDPVKPIYVEPDSYAHPNLYCDPEEKMERWIQKLSAMRKRKLEGEAL